MISQALRVILIFGAIGIAFYVGLHINTIRSEIPTIVKAEPFIDNLTPVIDGLKATKQKGNFNHNPRLLEEYLDELTKHLERVRDYNNKYYGI